MLNKWFDATAAKKFGVEMATLLVERAPEELGRNGKIKWLKKNEKKTAATYATIAKRLAEFKKNNVLNVFKKAQLGSAFKFTLIDKGCDKEFSERTTTWLLLQCK